MAPPLTPSQVSIIKATVPVLAEHGNTITTRFYRSMLEANPDLKNVFNLTHQVTGHQPSALAHALYAYASNIDALGNLSAAVELICHKHASLYIKPEQYAIVGEFLLKTMKEVLGDACTEEILDAWGAAYWGLADIMIGKEAGLFKEAKGWDDWKEFKITRKEKESEEISSFYLEPVEHFELPIFKPGQYISVQIFVDELQLWQARQYSLSDAPGKPYLRISVKREKGLPIDTKDPKVLAHEGYLSNLLHATKNVGDVVRVSHPFGDFFYEEKEVGKENPVVLISAGVGLTCLMSILNTLTSKPSSRPISWIHVARNAGVRAFKAHLDELVETNKNLKKVLFTSSPGEQEVQGTDYDIKGKMDLDQVNKEDLFLQDDAAQYFVCGPVQFMGTMEKKLKSYGVPSERINMELFGTGGVPRV
ncbi:globin-like protein [Delitschia confertaspora ATCC 74209]|uniref:nitric oxide dioxygenase n=1 Tax=Delitschia confertaspora ATCC 74209 TaxID=1513339 RepID=A0A9P4JSW2_9PLEO|nr:globin-like protein [Delitschia confertaspora ATCC 74209]